MLSFWVIQWQHRCALNLRSYVILTSSPVSTEMSDHLQADWHFTSHTGQLSLAILLWCRCNESLLEKAATSVRIGHGPGLLVYWSSPLINALAVLTEQATRGWHASLIVFNPRRLKGCKGDELPRNGLRCVCPHSSMSLNVLAQERCAVTSQNFLIRAH